MTAGTEPWLTFQFQLADYLADSWRLWAVMGALLAVPAVMRWMVGFIQAKGDVEEFLPSLRFTLAIALLFGLLATVAAGAIIPLANDGRLADLNTESPIYRTSIAGAWLFWGMMGWGAAIGFARKRRFIIAASFVWWMAAYIGSGVTMGAQL